MPGLAAGVAPVSAGALVLGGALLGLAVPSAGLAAGEASGEACGDEVGVSSPTLCRTELCPVRKGSESARATSMKSAAAAIVIFDSSVCVPRGPKAVLEMLLEKSAPASALPGCKSTETIKTMHEAINSMYKRVVN